MIDDHHGRFWNVDRASYVEVPTSFDSDDHLGEDSCYDCDDLCPGFAGYHDMTETIEDNLCRIHDQEMAELNNRVTLKMKILMKGSWGKILQTTAEQAHSYRDKNQIFSFYFVRMNCRQDIIEDVCKHTASFLSVLQCV